MGFQYSDLGAEILAAGMSQRIQDNTTSGVGIVYVGVAYPGTAETEAKWSIKRITVTGTEPNVLTEIEWANGTALGSHIWDDGTTDYSTYSYS